MPGAVAFAHHLHDAAVLMNEVVRGDLRFRRAEPGLGRLAGDHVRIVQDDDVGSRRAETRTEIRRDANVRAGVIGRKAAHITFSPRSIIS